MPDPRRFPWLRSATLQEFAETVATRPGNGSADRAALGRVARDFHERAGTLTERVRTNLASYTAGVSCVRVAHQPNFLPAINIAAQAATCHRLNDLLGRRHAEVFFLLDYDTNDDRRYRHATMPSLLSRDRTWTVTAPPLRSRPVVMDAEPEPSPEFLAHLVAAIHLWAGQQAALVPRHYRSRQLRRQLAESIAELETVFDAAGSAATNLADFNAIVLSWMVNTKLGLPTIFVPGSAALRSAVGPIVEIWRRRGGIAKSGPAPRPGAAVPDPIHRGVGPLWKRCACGARLPLAGEPEADRLLFRCDRCGASGHVGDDNVAELAANGDVLPKVIADDLLDGYAWGNVAGCDYRGGLAHYRQSAVVAAELDLPALPVFLSSRAPWADAEHLTGHGFQVAMKERVANAAARIVTSGRTSMILPLLWGGPLGADRLADEMASVHAADLGRPGHRWDE